METRSGFDGPNESSQRTGTPAGAPPIEDPLTLSVALVLACDLARDAPIICVGGASEPLAAALLARGFEDLTIVDPSRAALETLCAQPGGRADKLTLCHQDVTRFRPHRRYALWHDGGSFHYLTHADDRQEYLEVLQQALSPGGHLVIETFGPEGPQDVAGVPVVRYTASALLAELGRQFELTEHHLVHHRTAAGEEHQYLHGRFCRHAPRWPH
jgi:SAM-dependent methyltransferase